MVYAQAFASRAPEAPDTRSQPSHSYASDDWADTDWKIDPDRLRAYEAKGAATRSAKRTGWWGKITRAALTGLAALALTGNLGGARNADEAYGPAQTAPANTQSTTIYHAGVDAPNSLWGTAAHHLAGVLPAQQPSRDQLLIEATDALALENGLCAPSVWHAQYPQAGYTDDLSCEDGTRSPHILAQGQPITAESLDALAQRLSTGDEVPVPDTYADDTHQTPWTIPPWAVIAGSAAAITTLAAIGAYGGRRREEEESEVALPVSELDAPLREPITGLIHTPYGNTTLAYGHAYLARKNYLDRTIGESLTGTRLAGSARTALERKSARLNRLAAALDSHYVTRGTLADTVREALGIENLTDRTARRYVEDLADLGHGNARAYLDSIPKKKRAPSAPASEEHDAQETGAEKSEESPKGT